MPTPKPAPGYAKHPDHKVVISRHPKHVRVKVNGRPVAESDETLVVQESGYDPVLYFPRKDVAMTDFLVATKHHTHCPFKGEARYWSLNVDGQVVENAAWSYEDVYDEAESLRGYVAFYADRVDSIDQTPIESPTEPPRSLSNPRPTNLAGR